MEKEVRDITELFKETDDIRGMKCDNIIYWDNDYFLVKEREGCWSLCRREKVWLKEPTLEEVSQEIDINYSAETVGADNDKYKPSGDFIDKF